jgi:hypothetical protein
VCCGSSTAIAERRGLYELAHLARLTRAFRAALVAHEVRLYATSELPGWRLDIGS